MMRSIASVFILVLGLCALECGCTGSGKSKSWGDSSTKSPDSSESVDVPGEGARDAGAGSSASLDAAGGTVQDAGSEMTSGGGLDGTLGEPWPAEGIDAGMSDAPLGALATDGVPSGEVHDDASARDGPSESHDRAAVDSGVADAASLSLSVQVGAPPAGNPLARELIVTANQSCSLSGFVKTDGEPGRGNSLPAETAPGLEHHLWFAGLLPRKTFHYAIYLAGRPEEVLAAGSFATPALPLLATSPSDVVNGPQVDRSIWVAIPINIPDPERPARVGGGQVMIFDRQGRPRFFHDTVTYPDATRPQFMEGLVRLPNNDLAWANRNFVPAVTVTGREYVLFDVQLNQPSLVHCHHQGSYQIGEEKRALVLFNRLGDGVQCDLVTPSDTTVGDGVAFLDANGVERNRWTIFGHLDEVSPETLSPCDCDGGFWRPGTYDWTHANSVYPIDDGAAFVISLRNVSRILKVDAATGEIIWQMGKGLDFTWLGDEPEEDQWFINQHDGQPLNNGHFLIFDNSNGRYNPCRANPWSRVIELDVDPEAMTVRLVWEHRVPYAAAMGSAVRLSSGNTLIGGGSVGHILEVTPDGQEIWSLRFPTISQSLTIFNAQPYPAVWDYDAP
jgi:hypothetical protein